MTLLQLTNAIKQDNIQITINDDTGTLIKFYSRGQEQLTQALLSMLVTEITLVTNTQVVVKVETPSI